MSATDWFQKMMKALEENLSLPVSLNDPSESNEPQDQESSRFYAADSENAADKDREKKTGSRDKSASMEPKDSGEGASGDVETSHDKPNEQMLSQQQPKRKKGEGIADWADAMSLMAALQKQVAQLKTQQKSLEEQLQAEKDGRLADRKQAAIALELIKAGTLDADYISYKMGSEAAFDQEGCLLEAEEFVREAKKRFPSLFRAAFAADIEGVTPGDGGMGGGRRPDTGFLTYSQERRLRERV